MNRKGSGMIEAVLSGFSSFNCHCWRKDPRMHELISLLKTSDFMILKMVGTAVKIITT